MSEDKIYIPESIDEKLAFEILSKELMRSEPIKCPIICSEKERNARVVKDILEKYIKADVDLLDGRIYGDGNE